MFGLARFAAVADELMSTSDATSASDAMRNVEVPQRFASPHTRGD